MLAAYPLWYFVCLVFATGISVAIIRVIKSRVAFLTIVAISSTLFYLLSFQRTESILIIIFFIISMIDFCVAKLLLTQSIAGWHRSAIFSIAIALNVFVIFYLRSISLAFTSIFLINHIVVLSQICFRPLSPRPLPWITFNFLYPRLLAGPIVGYSFFFWRVRTAMKLPQLEK